MDEVINRACDLMADGAKAESISRNGANEHISVGQIQSIIAARSAALKKAITPRTAAEPGVRLMKTKRDNGS